MLKIFDWRKNFFIILAINFVSIALVPLLIRGPLFGVDENLVIFIIVVTLLVSAYLVSLLYLRELRRLRRYQLNLEDRLQETFKYIGSVNLQMAEMKESFSNFKKYPENKKDIKTAFNFFAEKILSIINIDWVIIRIIDTNTMHSLRDERYTRNNQKIEFKKFDNAEICNEKHKDDDVSIVRSNQAGFYLKTCCVIPGQLKNKDQEFFIQSMINQLEMLFVIFSSLEKNKNNKK